MMGDRTCSLAIKKSVIGNAAFFRKVQFLNPKIRIIFVYFWVKEAALFLLFLPATNNCVIEASENGRILLFLPG